MYAVKKLITEADAFKANKKQKGKFNAQVAGAFYKEGLGDIDLVWGNENIGLQKIVEKHKDDFKSFGDISSGLREIIHNGKVVENAGVKTIWYKKR